MMTGMGLQSYIGRCAPPVAVLLWSLYKNVLMMKSREKNIKAHDGDIELVDALIYEGADGALFALSLSLSLVALLSPSPPLACVVICVFPLCHVSQYYE